jgi:hypothetical protein
VTRNIDELEPSPRWAPAELFALTGLVIAQPVLDVTGRSPDMFLFRRADRLDILLLVAAVTVLPALGIWALEVAVGLVSQTVRRHLHLAAITGLFMLLAVEVVKATTGLRGPRLAAVAAAGGLLGGVLYAGLPWPRLWLRFLSPAPLAFALLFLLVSPTSALVLPARAPSAPDPPAVAAGDRPPVVILLFDEFPLSSLLDAKGQIDRRVYPNFAALAGQSTWYRNATGVAGFTPWALPSMLTGNYPDGARAPSYTEYPDNLFTLFGRYYDVTAHETISQLCPPRHCTPAAGNPQQSGLRGVVGDSARVLKQILQPYDAAFDPACSSTRPDHGRSWIRGPRTPRLRTSASSRPDATSQRASTTSCTGSGPANGRPCISSTCCCPTSRGATCRRATSTTSRPSGAPSEATGCRLRWSSWPTSSTCSSWPTPTGWSARSSASSRPSTCGTSRWSSWGPTTARAGRPASPAAPSGSATPPT